MIRPLTRVDDEGEVVDSTSDNPLEKLIVSIVIEDDSPLSVLDSTIRHGYGELPPIDVTRSELIDVVTQLVADGVLRVSRVRYTPDSGEFELKGEIPMAELGSTLRSSEAWVPPIENPTGDQLVVGVTPEAYDRLF